MEATGEVLGEEAGLATKVVVVSVAEEVMQTKPPRQMLQVDQVEHAVVDMVVDMEANRMALLQHTVIAVHAMAMAVIEMDIVVALRGAVPGTTVAAETQEV
jgi:hypothetical protein